MSRPPMADLPARAATQVRVKHVPGARVIVTAQPKPEISAELAAAVAVVTAQSAVSGTTAAPFITAMQKEAVARELKRRVRVRVVKFALVAAAAVFALHIAVTRFFYRAPTADALLAHLQTLPEAVVPFFSSLRQPLQADGAVLSQSDALDARRFRFVATVTLRLRKPLYAPAVTNGTTQYRRLQEAMQTAREQELRFKLFAPDSAPEAPSLPLLLQRVHQAGETIVVRVPFTARRVGWQWRLDAPQLALRTATRGFDGDSLDHYAQTPHLIFGGPTTLADIRQRVKLAHDYVLAVAKEVQRHADVEAAAEPTEALPAIADQPALPADFDSATRVASIAERPAFDPDAPAIVLADASKTAGFVTRVAR